MTTTIRSSADGSKSYIAVGGTDRVTIGSQGIETGSLAPGSVTPTELSQKLTAYTAVVASGTAIDFTGIPSWARRVTVMFSGTSLSGTSAYLVQIGAETLVTSGYSSASGVGTTFLGSTTGFVIFENIAARTLNGTMTLVNISANTWVASHAAGCSTAEYRAGGGTVSLGGTLARLRITTVKGTDTFDAGTINIMWE